MAYTLRPPELSQLEVEPEFQAHGQIWTIDSYREPFSKTAHAQNLRDMEPRFTNNYAFGDLDKFRELMGMDVDPYEHGPYQTRTVTVPLLNRQRNTDSFGVTKLTRSLILPYSITHDDHEGTHAKIEHRKKDVAYTDQTLENKQREWITWEEVTIETHGDISTTAHRKNCRKFAGPQASMSERKLLWDSIERIGYFLTAMRGWQVYQHEPGLLKAERDTIKKLAIDVFGRHIDFIEETRDKIVFSDDVLNGLAKNVKELRSATR